MNSSLNIDSTKGGLVCDEFRRTIPDPTEYRPFVKQRFYGIPSYAGDNSKYTPEVASIRSGFRSGRALALNFTVACPPLQRTDCEGVWLAFGECEARGARLVRFAIERSVAAGGQRCAHLEGETKHEPC